MTDYSGRLRKADWAVRPITRPVALQFVRRHHYAAGGSNTGVYIHGLYRLERPAVIEGIAWWIPPTRSAAEATYPTDWQGVLALSRLAIAPDVPKNACSFLLARSRRLIDQRRWPCLVTYADKGQGHTGSIYKADGWTEVGETDPEPTFFKDGVMISRKAGARTRTLAEMEEIGAKRVGDFARIKFVRISPGAPAVERPQLEMAI